MVCFRRSRDYDHFYSTKHVDRTVIKENAGAANEES